MNRTDRILRHIEAIRAQMRRNLGHFEGNDVTVIELMNQATNEILEHIEKELI